MSRSSRYTPSIFMASTIASTLLLSRPSEKLGTHSTKVDISEKDKGRRLLAASIAPLQSRAGRSSWPLDNLNGNEADCVHHGFPASDFRSRIYLTVDPPKRPSVVSISQL